jgi:hypothetical protein
MTAPTTTFTSPPTRPNGIYEGAVVVKSFFASDVGESADVGLLIRAVVLVAGRAGKDGGVKVERPQRSEDERP